VAITEAFARNGVTVGTSEYSIPADTTTGVPTSQTDDGVFQLWVTDQGNMTKTEEYQISIYEKIETNGPQKLIFRATIKGVQSEAFVTPTLILLHGWDMTLKKLAGTDRAFDASIRKVA
jgi:hypothetical protein